MGQSVLNRSFAVSLVVHSGLVGLLLLLAQPPGALEKPIQVRFVEPPPVVAAPSPQEVAAPSPPPVVAEPIPQPRPRPAPPPPRARRGSSEPESLGERIGRPEGAGASAVPQPPQEVQAPPTPPPQVAARAAPEAVPPPAPPPQPAKIAPEPTPPPQVAARPTPETVPPPEPRREFRQERAPERGGLSLSGPSQGALPPPIPTAPAPTARPSLRDQIAGLGSGLRADTGAPAKHTLSLDDRRPRFFDYLARLKRQISSEWSYPEEAQRVGVSGDVEVVFTLNPAGTLVYLQLTRSSGFPVLDNEVLRAVKTAAPYDPFPPQMGAESVNIVGQFTYYSVHRYRRN